MDHLPLVSIGIPNYNYSRYIATTLNSVASQTYPNIELIIIDDCSTDNSVAVIEEWITKYQGSFKINFIKNLINQGLTKVCNQVLHEAGGKYFQTLDADDLLLPGKIEQQVRLLEGKINTAFIYSNIGVIDENGNMINADYLGRIGYNKDKMPEGNIFEKLFEFNFIPLPSVLINTAFAKSVGGFDSTLQVQDYYLWLKLSEQYDTIYLAESTALYRVHSDSMSNSSISNPKSYDSILTIKFRYYQSVNPHIKKIIRKNIHSIGTYLYRFNYPTAVQWLKKGVLLNPGFKSITYYTAIRLGIPFDLFKKVKSKFYDAFKAKTEISFLVFCLGGIYDFTVK